MYETYPKGGKTTHKMEKHESMSLPKGNASQTRYPKKLANVQTNESMQKSRKPFLSGGGNKQVSYVSGRPR